MASSTKKTPKALLIMTARVVKATRQCRRVRCTLMSGWFLSERARVMETTVIETESPYLQENIERYTSDPKSLKVVSNPVNGVRAILTGDPTAPVNPLFREAVNGFLFGNTPGLTMKEGERVRWYLMATSNFELHAPHWHGNTVEIAHMRTDVASVLTMGMLVADMVPDNPGTWLFHCHVGGHLRAGMQALYTVEPRAQSKVAAAVP